MKLTLYYRNPNSGAYSIERVFDLVASKLPPDIDVKKVYSTHLGAHPLRVLANIREAQGRQGDVNHITGDVYYLAKSLDPRKTITTIHDLGNLEYRKGLRRRLFKWLWFEMPIRRSRIVTTVSEYTRGEILRQVRCNPTKVKVIYVPLDPTYKRVDREFNVVKPSILMVGSVWNKNLERQIEALQGIACRVTLVGSPPDSIRAAFDRSGIEHQIVKGLTDDEMRDQYVSCDFVLFASLLEGFGMPIVEANAVGRSVITGDRTSMPEIAGDAALLVDPTDVAAIRGAVLRVIGDSELRQSLVERGFRNAERFGADRIVEQYVALYREIHPAS